MIERFDFSECLLRLLFYEQCKFISCFVVSGFIPIAGMTMTIPKGDHNYKYEGGPLFVKVLHVAMGQIPLDDSRSLDVFLACEIIHDFSARSYAERESR